MNPATMTFQQWLVEISINGTFYGIVPAGIKSPDWRKIAQNVTDDTRFQPYSPPDPSRYETWVSWAKDLQQAVGI